MHPPAGAPARLAELQAQRAHTLRVVGVVAPAALPNLPQGRIQGPRPRAHLPTEAELLAIGRAERGLDGGATQLAIRVLQDHVDHPRRGALAPQHAGPAAQDLDAIDQLQRDRRQARRHQFVLADAQAIHQHRQVLRRRLSMAPQVQLGFATIGQVAS